MLFQWWRLAQQGLCEDSFLSVSMMCLYRMKPFSYEEPFTLVGWVAILLWVS